MTDAPDNPNETPVAPPDRSPEAEHLFVYGTLQSGFHNAPAVSLRHAADFVGPARFQGRMHLVRGPRGTMEYPTVVASEDPGEQVRGELYRLRDRAVLRRLDEYEACAPTSPQPHEYRRVVAGVLTPDGQTVRAYVYLSERDPAALPRIEGGVFPPPRKEGDR